jgi:hypothetical protein
MQPRDNDDNLLGLGTIPTIDNCDCMSAEVLELQGKLAQERTKVPITLGSFPDRLPPSKMILLSNEAKTSLL